MLWAFPVATVWSAATIPHRPGESNGVVIAIAVLPVLWFVDALVPIQSGELLHAVVTCISGIALMGLIGVLQDLLYVPRPRRIVAVSLIGVLASLSFIPYIFWLCGISDSSSLAVMFAPILFMLVVIPNLVFVFGIGSIVVYVSLFCWRSVHKTALGEKRRL